MQTAIFPKVTGKNLQRKTLHFPQDFPARFTLVLMAFYRHHQLDIDTWLPFASDLESEFGDLAYLEFPVIYKMGPVGQFMLNEGMRAGIPNRKAREKTITLYLNKTRFLEQLGVSTEKDIQIFLVQDDGQILWHGTGPFSQEKGAALQKLLQTQL